MTTAVRTAEERFGDLPDFAYTPTYLDDLDGFPGLRIAYVDEGPADAEHTFLCLHGQPTWGYRMPATRSTAIATPSSD